MNALLTGEPLSLVNGGEQRRAYLYIRDATEAHLRIIENEGNLCSRRIFNVGNPANETSIRDLAVLMSDIWRERFMSPGEVLPGLREVSGEEFYGVGYDDIDRRLPLIDAIRECTGWEPVYGLREMLVEIMEYYHRRVGSIA